MTETLIQAIAEFVAPMGWTATLHSESPGGVSVRLIHAGDSISHGAWITDEEIASGAWHEKVLFVVQPPKPAEAPPAPVDEPRGGRWVDPGPQAPVQPASSMPAQPLAPAPPALTMADILAKLELINEAKMYTADMSPQTVPALAAKASADGTTLAAAAAAVMDELARIKAG